MIRYTHYLADIDEGRVPNPPAPRIVLNYWQLQEGTTLCDVVLVVRADEAHHRDVNHEFASIRTGAPSDTGRTARSDWRYDMAPRLSRREFEP